MLQKDVIYNRLRPASAQIAGGRVEACNDATIMGLTPTEYIKQFARWGVTPKFAGSVMRELHRTHLDPDATIKGGVNSVYNSEKYAKTVNTERPAKEGMLGYADNADTYERTSRNAGLNAHGADGTLDYMDGLDIPIRITARPAQRKRY